MSEPSIPDTESPATPKAEAASLSGAANPQATEKTFVVPKVRLSDPLIIAMVTGIAYLFSYELEEGYLAGFNIPSSFVGFGNKSIFSPLLLTTLNPMLIGALLALTRNTSKVLWPYILFTALMLLSLILSLLHVVHFPERCIV